MEKDKEKEKKDEAGFELFGLGGLFKGIEKLVDLAGKLEEKGGISKEGELNFDHIKKGMKGVYGFTINTAGGGAPKVETFGNIKKTPEGPKVDEEREPITDLFNEKRPFLTEMAMLIPLKKAEENKNLRPLLLHLLIIKQYWFFPPA